MTTKEEIKSAPAAKKPGVKKKSRKPQASIKAVAFDLAKLMELEGTPIYNSLHNARVAEIEDEHIVVLLTDAGSLADPKALVKRSEFNAEPTLNDELKVYVEDKVYHEEGKFLKASITKAIDLQNIEATLSAINTHERLNGFIVGPVKGGYSVQLFAASREEAERGRGMRAFLPQRSAHVGRAYFEPDSTKLYEFDVEEFDSVTGSIIVNRSKILRQQLRELQDKTWERLAADSVVEGIVRSITDYGAFIEVYGVDGLLHRNDIAWDSKQTVGGLLKIGQVINVKVLEIDKEKRRLKLGLKQLTPDPWRSIENRYNSGAEVEGTIVALADFGAFVKLEEGIEGLIHLSEVSWKRIKHPSQTFHIGDTVRARVLGMEKDLHRISLSVKALERSPVEQLAEKFPVGTKVSTKVVGLEDYGIFVQLDENMSGLVHVGELSWTKRINHPNEVYSVGDEVEVVVMSFDKDRQRVSCSIKRLSDDPWARWKDTYARGTVHKTKVVKVSNQGAELELEPDLIAYCPLQELSTDKSERVHEVARVGQELEAMVISFEPARFKITMSVRALIERETKEAYRSYLEKQSADGGSRTTLGDLAKSHNTSVKN